MNHKKNDSRKINDEKNIVKIMIGYFCKKKHFPEKNMCPDCESLTEYAWLKLDKCFYGEKKPSCSKCSIHCFNPPMRKKIKDVMRYSGPRMIYVYPMSCIKQLMHKMNFNKARL
ncbi:MAG: nitrous oxide-stimulated promoter family protein [Candidatus Humimicrobiaceae bacterium]